MSVLKGHYDKVVWVSVGIRECGYALVQDRWVKSAAD
jgi:hypothetical protein